MPLLENGDMHCDSCGRDWYECDVDGEPSIGSRPRKVRLIKIPEQGDNINDVIKPL